MYEIKRTVEFSDIGITKKARLYNLPKWFQDVSIDHSESLGIGIPWLMPRDLAWLLTSWQIEIIRLPEYYEDLRVQTWPFDFKKAFGYRNYRLIGRDDELIATGYAVWVHTNTAKMSAESITEHEAETYGLDPKIEDFDYLPRKIILPDDMTEADRWPLPVHFADMHGHLNNVLYVEIAEDYIPSSDKISQIRVDYRTTITPGDIVVIKTASHDNTHYVGFYDESGKLHVSCSFIIND